MAARLLCNNADLDALVELEFLLPVDPTAKGFDFADILHQINTHRSESSAKQVYRRDFILRCLAVDQRDRMTASEALAHPWLNQTSEQDADFESIEGQYYTFVRRELHSDQICFLDDVEMRQGCG